MSAGADAESWGLLKVRVRRMFLQQHGQAGSSCPQQLPKWLRFLSAPKYQQDSGSNDLQRSQPFLQKANTMEMNQLSFPLHHLQKQNKNCICLFECGECAGGGQRKMSMSQFISSTTWIPGIKFRSQAWWQVSSSSEPSSSPNCGESS